VTARILQIAFAAALIWLLALPRPPVPQGESHSTYRPCNLIQQYCVVA